MRPFLLYAFSILLGISPLAAAQSSKDAGDLFVAAYMSAQKGEKEEAAGRLNLALSKLQEAAGKLDEVATEFPQWNPAVVKYRKERTTKAITRVKEKIAQAGPSREGESPSPARPAKPVAPAPEDPSETEPRLRELKKALKDRESIPKDWQELEFNGLKYYRVPL
jgi:hypothetical protein